MVFYTNTRRSAASSLSFSSGVPTVKRKQLAKSGCMAATFFTSTPWAFSAAKTAALPPTLAGTRSKIILARLGNTVVWGKVANSTNRRSRSAQMACAWRANSPSCSSANRAHSAVSKFTL